MFAVRIHGRGGQGAVTAAELLSVAAFDEGRYSQAFPTFGSERTGAPVVAFCRIDDRPIRLREPITDPDAVVVQDPTLLHQVDLFAGLEPGGFLLLNTSRTVSSLGLDELAGLLGAERMVTVPATEHRPGAPGATPPQCRPPGRLRRAHRRGLLGRGLRGHPGAVPRRRGRRERPGRRRRP